MTLSVEQAKALRAPFDPSEIGKLPKTTCKDCAQRSCSRHQKRECRECGGFHSTATIHLDYAGHAEVTDRLLDVDPSWDWEPMALDQAGLPLLDRNGGMWIRLTVHGTTRLGYGDAPGKQGGNAVKEAIGDAIRNAAMRFGVGLDLWRKTEKHEQEQARNDPPDADPAPPRRDWMVELQAAESRRDLAAIERLGREATAEGASTVVAQAKAAWSRVNNPPPPLPAADPPPPAEGAVDEAAPLPQDGDAQGAAPPTRLAGKAGAAQMHQNVRDAVTSHPVAGRMDVAARAKWRKDYDQACEERNKDKLDRLSSRARRANWEDLVNEAIGAFEAVENGTDIPGPETYVEGVGA